MTAFSGLEAVKALNGADEVSTSVVDSFRKQSTLLDRLPYHAMAGRSGGAAWTYTYRRNITQPTAAYRAIGEAYTPSVAETVPVTVALSVLGGSVQFDRAIANLGNAQELSFQVEQKVKGARALLHQSMILGDSSDPLEFDGLSKILADDNREVDASSAGDAWDLRNITTAAEANTAIAKLEELVGELDDQDGAFILVNSKTKAKINHLARVAGYALTETLDGFGRTVSTFNGLPILDPGARAGSNTPIIANDTDAEGDIASDIYVVRAGLDGFHGVIRGGGLPMAKVYLPDFEATPGPLATAEVEVIAGVAMQSTTAGVVARGVKVG